jgi:hypothetical protein
VPHFIRPKLPQVMSRALDAFRATDSVSLGEAFDERALMVASIDPKLLSLLGLPSIGKPLMLRSNLDISHMFAHEFESMTISHIDVRSELRVSRQMAANVDFEAKLSATGQTVAGCCMGIYTLSGDGRKIIKANTVCKLITPGWNFTFN